MTFNYQDPRASQVLLSGQFQERDVPMVRNAEGVWSATVIIFFFIYRSSVNYIILSNEKLSYVIIRFIGLSIDNLR